MAKVIGIDLGTTNSCVAVIEGGEPTVLENSEGGRTTPSMVAINPKSGERYIGQVAKRQAVTNPQNTVYSIKRFMGRKFAEVSLEVKEVGYEVAAGKDDNASITMGDKGYTPPEISAMILQKLKADAESKLGESVNQAVITVPAYFNDSQRQATKDAGAIAGLEVLRIINEPTAASLAYGLDKKADEVIAVYDLGGGTFDISILHIGEGVFEVKSTNGDTHLGGDDFDQRVMDWMAQEFLRDQGIDLRHDRMAIQRLKEAAEKAKVELSSVMETEINLPFVTADASGPKHLNMTLSRSKLEQLVDDLVQRTVGPVNQALKDAGITAQEVDEVVLVGGMIRMPAVIEKVKAVFGKEPHKGVNPDEVVALGAAIQAGVLQGEVTDILLLDVTPLTLGIETLGGVMTSLISRNTTIPTSKSEVFTTAGEGQTSVEVHVLQGERSMANENKTIGQFSLDGIPPSPRGVPQIEVAFDIDANGILNVSAKDRATSKEQRITITASSGLAKEEVEQMVHEAELHADEDHERRETVEARNQADAMAFGAEKSLREHADKISAELKLEVEEKVTAVRQALTSDDIARVRSTTADLSAVVTKIGEAIYQQAEAEAASTSEGDEPASNSETPPDEGGEKPDEGGEKPDEGGEKPDDTEDTVEGEYREV
jgi:molecular chaperone DnaK